MGGPPDSEKMYSIVLEALEVPEAERGAFLDAACAGDEDLRGRVENALATPDSMLLHVPVAEPAGLDETRAIDPTDLPSPLPVGRVAAATISTKPTAESLPTERVRHYRLVRQIGRGGMGVVYEGRDEKLDRRVAIKAIRWDGMHLDEKLDRFRQEAKLLAALDHANIGSIFSFEETDAGNFLILEYIEGETLGELFGRGPMPIPRAVDIARQMAEGLAAAHERGIVHRDLSPGNVMVRSDGTAKVLDFGLARSIEPLGRGRKTGPVAGTPCFMSPELLDGAPSTRAADSWAFACLLFECLTGERAFDAATIPGIFDRIRHGEVDLDALPAGTPDSVIDVIERCLVRDPARRLSDMTECAERLLSTSDAPRRPTAIDRWTATWQPLARRCRLGEASSIRLHLENPDANEVDVALSIEGGGWTVLSAPPERVTVPGRGSFELVVSLAPNSTTSKRVPSVEIRSGGNARQVIPVPSTIEIDATPATSIIGRTEELSSIEAWTHNLFSHAGRAIQVVGDEGSGRTRLLDEASRRARTAGVRVVRASARAGAHEPLELLSDLVRSYLGIFEPLREGDPRIEFARSRLREYVGDRSPASRFFLDLLRGDDNAVLETAMQQYRCYQLFGAPAPNVPLLFVIDDLAHADPNSIELLESVLHRARSDGLPVAALVSDQPRTGELDSERERVDAFLSSDLVEFRFDLPPLDVSEIDDLIDMRFPGANHRDYVPDLAERLLARAGGQPGPTTEMLRALGREDSPSSLFERIGATWRVDPHVDVEARLDAVPSNYAKLIEERLGRVPDEYEPVLEYAALLGSSFAVDPLVSLVDDEDLVDDALDGLESRQVIEPVSSDLSHYRFTHETLADAVVRRLDAKGSRRAARSRRKAAGALIADHAAGRGAARDSEELGLRLIALGQRDEALPHLLGALALRVRQRQVPAAQRIVRRLNELEETNAFDDASIQFEWKSLQGRTLTLAGNLEAAEGATEEARLVAQRADDPRGVLLCRVHLSEIAIRRGRYDVGRDLALAARESASELDLADIRREANRNLAIAYRFTGDADLAREIWIEDIERCRDDGDTLGESRAQNNLGVLLYQAGDWQNAETRFSRAAELARPLDQPDIEMIARVWLANIAFERGELEVAESGYRTAIARFRELQNRRALSRAYFNLAQVERLMGRFSNALEDFERACVLCRELADTDTEFRYRLDRVECALDADRTDLAASEWREVEALGSGTQADSSAWLHALVARRFGDLGTFRSVADRLEAATEKDGVLPWLLRVRHRPEILEDPAIVRTLGELLQRSSSFGELREQTELAALVERAVSDGPTIASIETRLGRSVIETPAGPWFERWVTRFLAGNDER